MGKPMHFVLTEGQRSDVKGFSTRVATRYEKRAENYLAMLTIAAILIWLK